jgi:acyl dehydratase
MTDDRQKRGERVPDAPRLMKGMTYEELPAGFRFMTSTRTITETDLVSYLALVGIHEPTFFDARVALSFASADKRLIPGPMTFIFGNALVVQTNYMHGTGVGFLHAEVDAVAPVYVGDTIDVVAEVVESRPTSRSRGVVTIRHVVRNQQGDTVTVFITVRLVKGKDWESGKPDAG